ncbi:hypothetical protein H072_7490 [Dactylellina haptotyla CBS 200.50]|uniref:Uncharacterized protein n=1 Tax=Dactylellina haptotyla (strain CBS 200.50) TaxID=1284197 RepID=S8BHF3_DACHA|nr:hypothetical protein H072_7490 [Dactylellina haptotyla CBS 200.50]
MASTPPPRSPVLDCPDAPLWPAKYEQPREAPRRSNRIARQSTGEPTTPGHDDRSTPPPTTRKDKSVAKSTFGAGLQTPMKKKSGMPHTPASLSQSAKAASRISKFSLDQRADNQITIFEDSNARIPGPIGEEEDDIFKTSNATKRRRTAPVVEFQPPTNEGMMVTQRGRKHFKKFDEAPVFSGPMPRKNLFANFPRPSKARVADPIPSDPQDNPIATDDEETEREETPEPPTRNVRFLEAEKETTITSASSLVTSSPVKAVAKPKTPRRGARSTVEIDTSFLTPPATIQRDHTSSFESVGSSFERSSVKRKLSYTGPATPEATPAKKRTKVNAGASPVTPRDDDVFASGRPRRAAIGKTRV